MTIDTSTMLVIGLLVFAASLASYALSLSPAFRENRGLFVTGISVGTALLLAAAVIAIVATNALSLRFSKDASSSDEIASRARVGNPFARISAPREPAPNSPPTMLSATSQVPLDDGMLPSERYAVATSRHSAITATSATTSQPLRSPNRSAQQSLRARAQCAPDSQSAKHFVRGSSETFGIRLRKAASSDLGVESTSQRTRRASKLEK
jgi:cell division septation protein DedD